MKYNDEPFLEYRTRLTEEAKINRQNLTMAERKIWYELLCRKKTGYKFIRQKPILNFILDFYCAELLLAIEIDGGVHFKQRDYDNARTGALNDLGIKVLRYRNLDVLQNIQDIRNDIVGQINIREEELDIK